MIEDNPREAFFAAGSVVSGAVESVAFGAPCFKLNNKVFCWFSAEEIVCRLDPAGVAEALTCDGARLFDPSGQGRPMKAWVQIPFAHADEWADWAQRAASALGG
ncbi:hypothetical protein D1871_08395 [Nakamurella silvestris]|nr:hypothetical protein D1871_08395 [Nakamurella silvestris]